MKKIKLNLILLIALVPLLTFCGGVRDALEGEKRSEQSDEFLVKKKNPLQMPPDINKLPKPGDNLEVKSQQNNEEVKVGEVLGLDKAVIESYIKSPKQYTLATDTYKIILPKKTNKQAFQKFFLENNYTIDDIEYMLGGENVKDNETLKRTILDILKDVQAKRFTLKPKVR